MLYNQTGTHTAPLIQRNPHPPILRALS